MSEQEEYLDRLLNGLNEGPEDELEDFSFDEDIEDIDDFENMDNLEDIDDLEDIGDIGDIDDFDDLEDTGEDTDSFFDEMSPDFEDIDSLGLDEIQEEQASGSDVPEYDFQEDGFQPDGEALDVSYEEEAEDSDFSLDSLSAPEGIEDSDSFLEDFTVNEESGEEMPETFDSFGLEEQPESFDMPELEELSETFDSFETEEQPESFELPETEELQIAEETPEEMEIPEEATAEYSMDSVEEETSDDGVKAEDISDAEALSNILNAFADEEETEEEPLQEDFFGAGALEPESSEEENLAEEAVLNTPEDLGLELEEVDEPAGEIEEEVTQKKKKKREKEKRKKDEKKEESQEKKPGLLQLLLAEDEEEELTPEELEAEQAKIAEKAEKKEAKKAAAAEKKQQAKEAAATKKAEKEAEKKRKKEAEEPPEPWPVVTKKIMPLMFLFGATFVAVVIILSNVLSYSPYVSTARQYFDNRQYAKAYEQLMGIQIKEKDEKFFNQVVLMNQLQVKITSSKNHLMNGEKELAVNDLIQAVLFYNNNLEKAGKLGLENEFQIVYASLQTDLSENFGISVEEAVELGAITDAGEYQSRIKEIAQ